VALSAALAALGCAHAPRGPAGGGVTYLDQGWSDADRRSFYHTTQGTWIVPSAWFRALEERARAAPFAASDYVERYRFIPDPDPRGNPERLPVGFAEDVNAETGETYVGFTCAACHTGQITHRGAALRIDGGAAPIDISGFTGALFAALADTAASPEKFDRFARAVLGDGQGEASLRALREGIERTLEMARIQTAAGSPGDPHAVVAGFGRLDALGRAGNLLFGLIEPRNVRESGAPVSYPCLWGAWDYDWVQWNGSVEQPMGRNIGEALGVGARVVLGGAGGAKVRTSIHVDRLHELESLARKLRPPPWPESVLGPIDRGRAARGRILYEARCASCHEPALAPADEHGKRFLAATMVPLDVIGTDPGAARDFHERTADTGALGLGTIPAARGLQIITSEISRTKYDELGLSPAQRAEWDGYRPNEWRAPLAYRARSLHGVWATAPYLHNGSVPNLYELLLPAAQRSRRFFVGSSELDPQRVGFRVEPSPGAFEVVTEGAGNSNAGHELRDGPAGNGVIGPALEDEERWDLVEYLKTL
jgi:cytochrome c5